MTHHHPYSAGYILTPIENLRDLKVGMVVYMDWDQLVIEFKKRELGHLMYIWRNVPGEDQAKYYNNDPQQFYVREVVEIDKNLIKLVRGAEIYPKHANKLYIVENIFTTEKVPETKNSDAITLID